MSRSRKPACRQAGLPAGRQAGSVETGVEKPKHEFSI